MPNVPDGLEYCAFFSVAKQLQLGSFLVVRRSSPVCVLIVRSTGLSVTTRIQLNLSYPSFAMTFSPAFASIHASPGIFTLIILLVLRPLAFVLIFYALALTLVGILCRFPIVVQKAGAGGESRARRISCR